MVHVGALKDHRVWENITFMSDAARPLKTRAISNTTDEVSHFDWINTIICRGVRPLIVQLLILADGVVNGHT